MCLATHARTIQVLRDLILSKRPNFPFLMETLIDVSMVEANLEVLRFEGCHEVNNEGHSGGLIMFWQDQKWVTVLNSSRNHIDFALNIGGLGSWRLTGRVLRIP